MKDFLKDENFLQELFSYKHKVIYGKIIAMTADERDTEEITGIISSGSVQISGTSAVRRTCNLSLLAADTVIHDVYWSLNTKFKLFIGLNNEINDEYDPIVWFKQGIFLITSFSTSEQTNGFSISLSGKDKMANLNGDLGGHFYASTNLGETDEYDRINNVVTTKKVPIKEIIYNLLREFGQESDHNIIIEDVDDYGYELWEYRGEEPLYMVNEVVRTENDGKVAEAIPVWFTFDGNYPCSIYDPKLVITYDSHFSELDYYSYNDIIPMHDESIIIFDDTVETTKAQQYCVTKFEYGDTVGYHATPLVYAGELLMGVGETVVAALDKIRDMLGEYEYFYNTDGQFVFRKKPLVAQSQPIDLKGNNIFTIVDNTIYENIFTNTKLITSVNNNPNYADIRNDFAVWGQRDTVTGSNNLSIHTRLAIDTKPTSYTRIEITEEDIEQLRLNYPDETFDSNKLLQEKYTYTTEEFDWRELIYQMAQDYFSYHRLDNFQVKVQEANPAMTNGRTGYEQYYTDIAGFWRLLYFPHIIKKSPFFPQDVYDDELTDKYVFTPVEEFVYVDRFTYWVKETNEDNNKVRYTPFYKYKDSEGRKGFYDESLTYCTAEEQYIEDLTSKYYGWNKVVFDNPETLLFWFDFIEPHGDLEKYAIEAIGDRTRFINDTNVKSLYYKKTPDILYLPTSENLVDYNLSFAPIQIPDDLMDLFVISSHSITGNQKVVDLMYNCTGMSTNISISCVPIYYLEPNYKVNIYNEKSKIEGEFVIQQITVPLDYNGTMSISATKILNIGEDGTND